MKKTLLFFVIGLTFFQISSAQEAKDTIKDFSNYNRKFTTAVFFVGRYNVSMDKNVDFKGMHHTDPDDAVGNSFDLKYVRLQGVFHVNDKISANILVNLADFKSDPEGKVLENAYVKYAYNKYVNVLFGQFRPYFGLEDVFAFQLENSYDWSNQYNLFGLSGWQSFQLGAAFTGSLIDSKIPLSYYFSIYNGNGKNKVSDNNDQKNYTLRFEYNFKDMRLGVNGGSSRLGDKRGYAYGIDAQADYVFSPLFEITGDAEYKRGTNFSQFYVTQQPVPNLDNFQMQGFYIVPKLRFNHNRPRVRALEASFRYEILDPNMSLSGNSYQTYTPMLSIVGSGDYQAKISIVGVFNRVKNNVPNTSHYDSNLFITQIQVHF
jgi:hypothetical protein